MTTLSSSRVLAPCVAALLVASCGGVVDDRHTSGGATGSGGSSSGSGGGSAVTVGASSSGSGGIAPCPAMAWSHAYAVNPGFANGEGIAVDAACNIYVAGDYQGALDLGAGPLPGAKRSLFLAKLDPRGDLLWSRSYVTTSAGAGIAHFALDPAGNLLIDGFFNGSVDFGNGCLLSAKFQSPFVVKLDGDGNSLFCRVFPAQKNGVSAVSVASSAAGDLVVGGWSDGDFDYGEGTIPAQNGSHAFVLAFDSKGQLRWMLPFAGTDTASVASVTISAEGIVHTSGSFTGTLDIGLESAGFGDVFVTEIRADGTLAWARRFGGSAGDNPFALAPAPQGGFILAGTTVGEIDLGSGILSAQGGGAIFLARLDVDGHALGGKLFGAAALATLDGVAVNEAGEILLGGDYGGTVDFGGGPLPPPEPSSYRPFVARLGPDFEHRWSRRLDVTYQLSPYAYGLDRSGGALITGKFFGQTLDLGSGPLVAPPLVVPMFLARLPD
jgi:hypothetical protein